MTTTPVRRRTPRQSKAAQHVSSSKARCMALSMVLMAGFYLLLLIQAQFALDDQLEATAASLFALPRLTKSLRIRTKPYRFMGDLALDQEKKLRQQEAEKVASNETPRFIIFLPIQYGQGLGNIVSGLLAAHLLAQEFNRIVCVSSEYSDFLELFDIMDQAALEHCPDALRRSTNTTKTHLNTIRLITFEPAPNECLLQKQLRDGPELLFLTSNTYPRWPQIPQPRYFHKYYRPTPKLLQALPWKQLNDTRRDTDKLLDHAPHTVVHLRQSDGAQDARKGLDDATLQALGETLPSDTYLVTNRVAWYDYFHTHFGWRHPEWTTVIHSALHKQWGDRSAEDVGIPKTVEQSESERQRQTLQMWVDWYTILQAKTVYHTHSDFSISAIHWNDIRDTRTILGFDADKHELILVEESWRVDGETAPLVERTEFASGTARLRLCGHKA